MDHLSPPPSGRKADVAFVQSKKGKRDDPAPPATWDDKYKGQSEAGGTDAVSMLEYILKTTKALGSTRCGVVGGIGGDGMALSLG